MSTAVFHATPSGTTSDFDQSHPKTVPIHIWICVVAAVSITFGLYWDISWHMTIGRDTFWTPAHLLLQFGAVLAAGSSAYRIFHRTFNRNAVDRGASLRVLGFRGSLGDFICAWGGAAMLVSAPFDNWWHNAYGLDVRIISPPHMLLAIGFDAIVLGSIVLILREMNQAEGALKKRLALLFLLAGGAFVTLTMMGRLGYTDRTQMHRAVFYMVVSIGPPLLLEAMSAASGLRWARTAIASVYTVSFLLPLWIFPLFPGEPKIGPVYQHVTHMVSLGFPVLILAPASVLDLLWPKISSWRRWPRACVTGLLYVVVLLIVQWPWADFLMSPASRNWIFGTTQMAYFTPPDHNLVRNVFEIQTAAAFFSTIGFALIAAIECSAAGISFGTWMRRVHR